MYGEKLIGVTGIFDLFSTECIRAPGGVLSGAGCMNFPLIGAYGKTSASVLRRSI